MKTSNIEVVTTTIKLEMMYPGLTAAKGYSKQFLWTRALQEGQVTKEHYDEARLFYGLHNNWR